MIEDRKATDAAASVASTMDELDPKPPDVVAKMEWLRRYGKKHWGVVASAGFVVVVGWLVSTPSGLDALQRATSTLVEWQIQRTVHDLRSKYPQARDSLSNGLGDFNDVDKDVKSILKLDPRNGHALYYAGEVRRIKTQMLFSPKSCIVAEALASSPQPLDDYENDFGRYLDVEKALPETERMGGYSAETCYERASGYCPQRTAWIHHLLANDLFAEAMLLSNASAKSDKLSRALEHSQAAAKLYKDDLGHPGFGQCTATKALITEVQDSFAQMKR